MNIEQLLQKHYSIPITKIEKYLKIYKVIAGEQCFALKIYSIQKFPLFQIEILQHLEQNGFRFVNQIELTKNGDFFVYEDGLFYMLVKWIPGRMVTFKKYDQVIQSTKLLAEFHNHSINIDISNRFVPNSRRRYSNNPSFLEVNLGPYNYYWVFNTLKQWTQNYNFPEMQEALEWMKSAERIFPVETYESLVKTEKKQFSFIHGDFNYSNLITNGKDIYMIDFDYCALNVRLNDLIFLTLLNITNNIDNVFQIIKAYHQVRNLSREEFEIIKSQLIVPLRFFRIVMSNLIENPPLDMETVKKASLFLNPAFFSEVKHLTYKDL